MLLNLMNTAILFWTFVVLLSPFLVQSITYNVTCKVIEPVETPIPCELANFGGLLTESRLYNIHSETASDLCSVDSISSVNDPNVFVLTNHWGCSFKEKVMTAAQVGAGLVMMTSSTNAPFSPGSNSMDRSSMGIPFVTISTDDARQLNSYLREGAALSVTVASELTALKQCARRVHNYAETEMRGAAMDAFYRCYDPEMLAEPSYANCVSALNMSRTVYQLEGAFESLEILKRAKQVCWFKDYPDWSEPSNQKLLFSSSGEFYCDTGSYKPLDWFECQVSKNRVEFELGMHTAEVHLKLGNFTAAASEYAQVRTLTNSLKTPNRKLRKAACAGLMLITLVRGEIPQAMSLFQECGLSEEDCSNHLLWHGTKETVKELKTQDPEKLKEAAGRKAPKECCVPDWKSIFGTDPIHRPVCELALAHSQLGVWMDELGSIELSNANFKKYDKICAEAGKSLRTTLGTNVIAFSDDSMNDERHSMISKVKKITKNRKKMKKAIGYPLETLDYLWTQTPPTMMIGYQNINDRKAHEYISKMYQAIWPDLSAVSVSDIVDDDMSRPLKVGFASAFLGDHSVGRLINNVITKLSRQSEFDVYTLICPGGHPPKSLGKAFNIELEKTLSFAAAQIARLELDILIYPEIGMHSFTYFLSFHRLAPVQAVFWGHPVSQATPGIDYFLVSDLYELNPDSAWKRYSEQLILMEGLTTMFEKPIHDENQRWRIRINFGIPEDANLYVCAQSLMKFHPSFDYAIQQILMQDENGILVIVYNDNQIIWRSKLEERFRRVMGVEVARRVYFHPSLARPEFQSLMALADVVLDPFPWGGGVTTLEALATGRIVITLPSEQSVVQLAAGFLKHMGIEALVARDVDDYIDLAVTFATNGTFRAETASQILDSQSSLYTNKNVVKEWTKMLTNIARIS